MIGRHREAFPKSSHKRWMCLSHRLNTRVPVCVAAVCGEQLEPTRAPSLTGAIRGLWPKGWPQVQGRSPIPPKSSQEFLRCRPASSRCLPTVSILRPFYKSEEQREHSQNSSGSMYRWEVLHRQTNCERNDSLIPQVYTPGLTS